MADIGSVLLPELDRPTPQDVIRAYMMILGRRPESQAAIELQCALPDLMSLGERLLRSDEFRVRYGHELVGPAEAAAPVGPPRPAPARPAEMIVLRRVLLQAGSGAEAMLGAGWSVGEREGRWTLGVESVLRLADVPAYEDYLIRLELKPYHTPKRLQVQVGGITLLDDVVPRETVLALRVPGELVTAERTLTLTLRHQAPERPSDHSNSTDTRPLALWVRALTLEALDRGTPPADARDVAPSFESLGEDCAFGFYETSIGHEPVSLFRYNSVPLHSLVKILENRLAGFPQPDSAVLALSGGDEYVFRDDSVELVGHTSFSGRGGIAADEAALLVRQLKRMRFLKRMFNQRVDGDGTIFVYRGFGPQPAGAVLPVWQALRRRGRNALLWVCDADATRPTGTVERIEDGLLRGYVDPALAGTTPGSPRMLAWAILCRRAFRLWPGHDGD